jgi:hypothetical protein
MSALFNVSRSGYYRLQKGKPSKRVENDPRLIAESSLLTRETVKRMEPGDYMKTLPLCLKTPKTMVFRKLHVLVFL